MEQQIVPVPPACCARLFSGWHKAMVASGLWGGMGKTWATANGASAQLLVRDFCFFAGAPSRALCGHLPAGGAGEGLILVPQNEGWAQAVQAVWGSRAAGYSRYAFAAPPAGFDTARLAAMQPPAPYRLAFFDQAIYRRCLAQGWSRDLCAGFESWPAFAVRGLGVAVLQGDAPVAGAASYTAWPGGIEIEVDTHPAHRRKGLARAAAARLIAECCRRGLAPGWDAENAASAALAESLGYRPLGPYRAFRLLGQAGPGQCAAQPRDL